MFVLFPSSCLSRDVFKPLCSGTPDTGLIRRASVKDVTGTPGYGKMVLRSVFALKASLFVYQIHVCCYRPE